MCITLFFYLEGIPLVPNEKSYVDPTKFGDSEKAVRKFAKEIDRRQVKLEGEIGEGKYISTDCRTLKSLMF